MHGILLAKEVLSRANIEARTDCLEHMKQQVKHQ